MPTATPTIARVPDRTDVYIPYPPRRLPRRSRRFLLEVACLAGALAFAAPATSVAEKPAIASAIKGMSLSGGVEQSADADLEADGEVSVFRVNTQAAVTLSGANLSEGLMGGGIFGASYTVNETLTLGAGMGGISQIEDNALVFPVVFFHWRIYDRWRLGMRGDTARGGVEISYRISDNLETAIGASYVFHRFRLDDEGVAPNGVGETSSLPLTARVSYQLHPNISLEIYGGVAVAGHLRLEDQDGHRILQADVDPAPLAGVVVTASF